MSNLSQITVLYGENKLQKTIRLPATTTVTDAKKVGSKEILNHLRLQPGVPSFISIDDECTDFYPAALPNTRIGDLNDQATIVLWPKPAPGSTYTSSPIMDELSSTTTELASARARVGAGALINLKENKPSKQKQKSKPGSSSTPPSRTADADGSLLEKALTKLRDLEATNVELREGNANLKHQLEETNSTLKRAMEALVRTVQFRSDGAAQRSAKECIGESILSLEDEQERNDMIAVFKTVYGQELV